jgi:hypothetical protein
MRCALAAAATVLLSLGSVACARAAASTYAVPYVGCETDVMGGAAHYAAPRGAPRSVDVKLSAALQLSFYQGLAAPGKPLAGSFGPRGWHCYAYLGADIGETVVSPDAPGAQYAGDQIGPGISLLSIPSDAGAGFTFAYPVMKAYFPQHLGEFLRSAGAASGNTFARDLPAPSTGSSDTLQQLGDWSVLVTTPAHQQGFGTQSGWFAAGDRPVQTLIVVDSVDFWIYELRVRLPQADAGILPAILRAEPSELHGR